jgi:Ni/Fe-hydrogenase 1 B-type cytochrome subunit
MQPALKPVDRSNNGHPGIDRHPRMRIGQAIAVYVWEYPVRFFHWGLVFSIAALSFTGYYIHNPFLVGQTKTPFVMGWFRFAHEVFGFAFIALFIMRMYGLFVGSRWSNWRYMVPLHKKQWKEMLEVMKFYAFIRPTPVAKVGHNAIAALSYLGIFALMAVEIVTGLVMLNWLWHSPILGFFVGWLPHLVSIQSIRLVHFCLMFVFIAFGVFHVHLCLIVSSAEKRGLLDSIFTGYKIVPVDELGEDDQEAIAAAKGKRIG